MTKILLGFDGSAEAWRAARKAAELAASRGSTLMVVQVVPPIIISGDLPAIAASELTEQQIREAKREVDAVVKELAGGGAQVQGVVLRGGPSLELLRVAKDDPTVELVVVGRSGKGAFARALMGSVSSRLAHACIKPVLIIP